MILCFPEEATIFWIFPYYRGVNSYLKLGRQLPALPIHHWHPCYIYFFLFLGENGEILEAAQKAEAFIKELEDMQNSVVSNDSPILSSNVKSLQDLKAESPNKKLDRESLKQVSLIYVTYYYCKKDTEVEKKCLRWKFYFFKFL